MAKEDRISELTVLDLVRGTVIRMTRQHTLLSDGKITIDS